jgi:hypothetical protein
LLDKPTYVGFEHDKYYWKPDVDYKQNPLQYRIGRGQQGVLICQPYKNELYPLWRFKTPEKAQQSCDDIYNKFIQYLNDDDFVGADMAKKYLHMGFTRSRRYWNHSSGRKWINDGEWKVLPYDRNEKRFWISSNIFLNYWKRARTNEKYLRLKKEFKNAIIKMES